MNESPFDGKISGYIIINKALSDKEIQDIFRKWRNRDKQPWYKRWFRKVRQWLTKTR